MNVENIQKDIVGISEVFFGEWKSSNHRVSIYLHNDAFSSALIHQVGGQIIIDSSRIKCGINGTTSHALFIQRINSFAKEKLQDYVAVFLYPSQGLIEEVWIFEATKMTAPWIRKAKENLKQIGQDDKQISEWSQKALKNFETALKLQENIQGDRTEVQTAILQLKKDLFLINIKQDSHLYLSSSQDIEELNEAIGIYIEEEDIFSCLSEYVKAFEELSSCQQLIAALVHENANNSIAAVPYYLDLAEKHSHPLPCLKRAVLLIKAASDPLAYPHFLEKLDRDWLIQLSQKVKDPELEQWILHKDAVRMVCEKFLRLMSARSTQIQVPPSSCSSFPRT